MGVSVRWNKHKRAWYLYVHHNKRRTSQAFGDNKQAALDVAREITRAIKLGAFKIKEPREMVTFRAFSDGWFKTNARKPSTMRCYESRARIYLYPALGHKALSEITRDDVQALIATARANMSARSVRHLVAVLHVMLDAAVDAEILTVNPAHRAHRTIRREHVIDDGPRYLTRAQVSTLLDAIEASYPRAFYLFFLTLARTGMRIGECAALRVASVDLDHQRILINRTLIDGRYQTPKSGRERYVDMSDQLTAALRQWCEGKESDALLFHTQSGKPCDARLMRSYVWHPTIKLLKFGAITPHILRHTFASQLLSDGEPISYVSRQLGHSSIEITHSVYGHMMPSTDRSAVNSLDEPVATHPRRILRGERGCHEDDKPQSTQSLPATRLRLVR